MDKNSLVLAYLGDSIYEMYIRSFLIQKYPLKVKELSKKATCYVSAKGQAKFAKELLDQELFTDIEKQIFMRARNHKNSHPVKNTDIVTYKYATGLEAVIGYLYNTNQINRLEEIMNYIIKEDT